MIPVFLLLVYLGSGDDRKLVSGDMYFRNINTCNYFASRLAKKYGNYGLDPRDKTTAYCVPKYVKERSNIKIYD